MCRWTEEESGPTIRLPRYRHLLGFFNMPVSVRATALGHPFYGYYETLDVQ